MYYLLVNDGDGSKLSRLRSTTPADANADATAKAPILFSAVSALMSALAYRDKATAEHSQRVARLDPAEAWKRWQGEPFTLKWAAHLHRRAAFGAPAFDPERGTWECLQLTVKQGLDVTLDKLLAVDGGCMPQLKVELWIAPSGAPPPAADTAGAVSPCPDCRKKTTRRRGGRRHEE